MGVLNVTPDSFSGDGIDGNIDGAILYGANLFRDGAAIVDVGGESTRPGFRPVSEAEERERVLPVIQALAALGIPVSVDTGKARVAEAAVQSGAAMINDVSGGADPDMFGVAAASHAEYVVMHRAQVRGDENIADTVAHDLEAAVVRATAAGVGADRLWIDPGLGFGKSWRDNLRLLRGMERIVAPGLPVLVGPSRKGTIGKVLGGRPRDRLEGGLAVACMCVERGVAAVRMHDVRTAVRAVRMTEALATVREVAHDDM